ncbi:MAG: TetR/AcrR family transcriptional regulator [Myxococcota bacterium]
MRSQTAKRPRRLAKQDRARETVEAVVEASARVLVREGYGRATTNRIAEAAGVSVGTVYQYFRDKDEIFDALLDRESKRVVEALLAVPPDPATPLEDALRGMLMLAVTLQPHGPELYRYLDYVPNALFRRRLAEINKELACYVRQILELHRDRLRVDDLDVASFIVVHTAEALGYNAAPEMFNERLVDEVTDLLVRYLV